MFTTLIRKVSEFKPFIVGRIPFDLSFLPPGMAIDAARVVLAGSLNVPAAGVTALQLQRLLDNVEQERRIKGSGLALQVLDHVHVGRRVFAPAAIAQNAAAAVELSWPLYFRDVRGIDPSDHPPATDFYRGKSLDLFFADPTAILAALAVNAGANVYLEFRLSPLSVGKVPTSTVIGYVDILGRQTKLPGGLRYQDIIILKNDGADITAAELGNLRVTIDSSVDVVTRTTLSTLVRDFNRDGASEVGAQLAITAAPFVPAVTQEFGYKGTKLPVAREQVEVVFDGTLNPTTAPTRVYYRAIEERSEQKVLQAGAKVWGGYFSEVSAAAPKTASKNGVHESRGFLSGMASRIFGRPRSM